MIKSAHTSCQVTPDIYHYEQGNVTSQEEQKHRQNQTQLFDILIIVANYTKLIKCAINTWCFRVHCCFSWGNFQFSFATCANLARQLDLTLYTSELSSDWLRQRLKHLMNQSSTLLENSILQKDWSTFSVRTILIGCSND